MKAESRVIVDQHATVKRIQIICAHIARHVPKVGFYLRYFFCMGCRLLFDIEYFEGLSPRCHARVVKQTPHIAFGVA
jgi:hypothetical protein